MRLYITSYYQGEEYLCAMELKYLFDRDVKDGFFISEKAIDVNTSPFIKYSIDIICSTDTINEMVLFIKEKDIAYDFFKVKYIDTEEKMEFNEKHRIEGIIGYEIRGEASVHSPRITLGITRAYGKWIFGELKKNQGISRIHNKRPFQYSNALPTNIARAAVNIAKAGYIAPKIIDPCCGVGTVVMEGLSMGIDIKGIDINPKIVENAKENLKYFGYADVISEGDIHQVNNHYDSAIIDIPYGLLSVTTKEEQRNIIKSARRIADRLVLVSLVNMDEDLIDANFNVLDNCCVYKRDFKRYITLCE